MSEKWELLEQHELILRELGDNAQLAVVLGAQAELLERGGSMTAAAEKLAESEEVFRDVDDALGIEKALFGQVRVLKKTSSGDKLLVVLERQERFYRECGDKYALVDCIFNQMGTLHENGDLEREVRLSETLIPILREVDDQTGLATCYGMAATALLQIGGRRKDALGMARKAESIARNVEEPKLLVMALNTLSTVLGDMGRTREGLETATESVRTARSRNLSEMAQQASLLVENLIRHHLLAVVESLKRGRLEQARKGFAEANNASESIEDQEIANEINGVRQILLRELCNNAQKLEASGDYAKAAGVLGAAAEALNRNEKDGAETAKLHELLMHWLDKLAGKLLKEGKVVDGVEVYEKSLAIADCLVMHDAQNSEWHRQRFLGCYILKELFGMLGMHEEAEQMLEKGYRTINRMSDCGMPLEGLEEGTLQAWNEEYRIMKQGRKRSRRKSDGDAK